MLAEFLCYALTESNAISNIFLDKECLLLIIVERSHIRVRKFVCDFHVDGRSVDHHRNESLRISVDRRSRCLFAFGLRNVKDLFDIVGNSGRAVISCILNGFKK